MDNPIQVFNFENNTIRTIEIDNTIWFVAKDVASALGYSNTADAITRHCRKAKSLIDIGCVIHAPPVLNSDTCNLDVQTKLILESDVYRLTLKSTLPSAEKFQDWVVEEVLPSIRRTGSYNIISANNNQNHDLVNKLLEIQSRSLELQSKASERESAFLKLISKFDEKIEYEKYKSSINTAFELVNKIEFEKYVNIIRELSNINVRANFNEVTLKLYLYQIVKDHEKIFKSNGLPYEKYIDNGFYIVENGEISKVYITRKGSDHLFWFLKSKKLIS